MATRSIVIHSALCLATLSVGPVSSEEGAAGLGPELVLGRSAGKPQVAQQPVEAPGPEADHSQPEEPLTSEPAAASSAELAKKAQNPIADLISVPFQNNTNFNVGPLEGTQNILNIQPVIPITINENWNLITRTILPVIQQPRFGPGQGSTFGLGDIQLSGFLSPKNSEGLIWGLGAIAQLPTNTNSALGNNNFGLGPTAVALRQSADSPWVYGALVNTIWSIDTSNDPYYANTLIQPFVNYNFKNGIYFTTSPIITADWRASSSDRWTVPIGGGFGKIVRFGKLPVNLQLSGYYNVVRPNDGSDWQLRAQMQLLFPK